MKILGINGGPNTLKKSFLPGLIHGQYHDASVAMIEGDELKYAIEEERITRIKHCNLFPVNSLKQCLDYNNLVIDEIDYFAFSISENALEYLAIHPWFRKNKLLFGASYFLKKLLTPKFGITMLQRIFFWQTGIKIPKEKILMVSHHKCHAASTFFLSGFNDSLVITLDGGGDGLSGTVYQGEGKSMRLLKEFGLEESLGYLFLEVTEFLGYSIFDEYKIMGLASFGDDGIYKNIFDSFYELLPNGEYKIYWDKLIRLSEIVSPRSKEDPITQIHKNIAASLQTTLEIIVLHVISYWKYKTTAKNLCLAGGVALNCKMTGTLLKSNLFDRIFVFPASGDNGISVGAAINCLVEKYDLIPKPLNNVYLGREYLRESIEADLQIWSEFLDFEYHTDICEKVSELLFHGEIIAWFQDRDEFGPRALGNRSILADPRPKENRDRINRLVKLREGFRPFAPAILKEYFEEYFFVENLEESAFMSFVLDVKERYRRSLEAVCHIDGSARVQTVSKDINPKFWKLIDCFRKLSGVPVLLNTSFNNNVEPIIHTPLDAIYFFMTSDIEWLAIDNFLVRQKKHINKEVFLNLPEYIEIRFDDGRMVLFDLYHQKSHAISDDIANLIKEGHFIYSSGKSFLDEINRLWRNRLIFLSPTT